MKTSLESDKMKKNAKIAYTKRLTRFIKAVFMGR